jgi:hypothetical protein
VLYPIIIADGRFPPGNAGQLLYDDKVCRLSPFVELDGLHNHSDSNSIDVRIQILDQVAARHSGVRCLLSPNGGISAGGVVRPVIIRGHHADKATTFPGFPVGAGPNLRVVIR